MIPDKTASAASRIERYDGTSARHYAAYRPPLHPRILERALHPGETFETGLDVGCGTGASAVALTRHCQQVIGLEPSRPMLDSAHAHPRVTYVLGAGEALPPLPVASFAIVTFAGSLFYAKSDRLRRELRRVCAPGATVLAYDFEILLDDAMAALGVTAPSVASGYDHRAGISDWHEVALESSAAERLPLEVSPVELAHLLLSDSHRFDGLAIRLGVADPFEALVRRLGELARCHALQVDVFYGRWRWAGP